MHGLEDTECTDKRELIKWAQQHHLSVNTVNTLIDEGYTSRQALENFTEQDLSDINADKTKILRGQHKLLLKAVQQLSLKQDEAAVLAVMSPATPMDNSPGQTSQQLIGQSGDSLASKEGDKLETKPKKAKKTVLKRQPKSARLPLDKCHQYIHRVLEKERHTVKTLRKIIPKMMVVVYLELEEYHGKTKVGHLWDKAPADWPPAVPCCDPGNGKGKPKQPGLLAMFQFLKKKYLEKYPQPPKSQIQQQPNLHHPTEEQDHNSQMALNLQPKVTLYTPAHAAEPSVYIQSTRIISKAEEAKLAMINLEELIKPLRNEDFPGLKEKLQGLYSVLKTILETQTLDMFLEAANEASQLLQHPVTSSVNKKNENWSDLYMNCEFFIGKWASPKVPSKKLNNLLGNAPISEELFTAAEPKASIMNAELSLQTPENIPKEDQDHGWITSPAKQMEEETQSIQKPDIPPPLPPVQDFRVTFLTQLAPPTENWEKKQADLEKKGPDMSRDNQNFPRDASPPTCELKTSCVVMECGLHSVPFDVEEQDILKDPPLLDNVEYAMVLAEIARPSEDGKAGSSLPAEPLGVPPAPQQASTQIDLMDVIMTDDIY